MLDIHTIGAGGGCIGWLDEGGLLRMGPQSAGADPGPACYGKGGTLPTCTDANVVLGYLDPDFFAGGKIKLDRRRPRDASSKSTSPSRWACRSRRRPPACTASPCNNMAQGVRESPSSAASTRASFPSSRPAAPARSTPA